jgi:hypothetical protein
MVMSMNIDTIKRLVSNDHYAYSMHADIERKEDGLSFEEIEMAILSGEILEQYPDSGRGKSCLVVGSQIMFRFMLYVVCGEKN